MGNCGYEPHVTKKLKTSTQPHWLLDQPGAGGLAVLVPCMVPKRMANGITMRETQEVVKKKGRNEPFEKTELKKKHG